MARPVGSFLLRLWRTGRTQRIEIEHIQSGEKGLVTSVGEAMNWISTRAAEADDQVAAMPDQTDVALDDREGKHNGGN